jgi:hypothetical protein
VYEYAPVFYERLHRDGFKVMCVYFCNKLGECVKKTFLAEMAKEISKTRIMDHGREYQIIMQRKEWMTDSQAANFTGKTESMKSKALLL